MCGDDYSMDTNMVVILASLLKRNRTVVALNIARYPDCSFEYPMFFHSISNQGIKILANMLKENKTIKELNICGHAISDQTVLGELLTLVSVNHGITALNFQANCQSKVKMSSFEQS